MNFSKNEYSAAGQNWAVDVSDEGRIYFGNSKGLLQYSGAGWSLFPIQGNGYVRSVMASPDGKVYVGSFEEFGYFDRNKYGHLTYFSLSDSVKNYSFHNDEIWDITSYQNKIYFRSFSSYFVYDGKTVITEEHPFILLFIQKANNVLYAFRQEAGLCQLEDKKLKLVVPISKLNNDVAVDVLPYSNNKIIIPTSKNGIFIWDGTNCIPWENEVNTQLKSATINKAVMAKDSTYIIGTITDGVYAIDKSGKLIWKINTNNGLHNNTILGIAVDNDNNIWVASDNGISYIRNNSQLRFINLFRQNVGSVYSAIFHNNYLYLATNQGLFYCTQKNGEYDTKLIPGMSEQAWILSLIDNQLICGHNSGTFEITGEKTTMLSDVKGATDIRKTIIHGQEILVESTYTYLNIYKLDKSGRWSFSHSISDFIQPIRKLEVDAQGNIWASHFYKGLYCISLSPDLKKAEKINYYPSLDNNKPSGIINLFKIKGRMVFNDTEGFYTFDDLSNKIIPYNYLNEELGTYKDIRNAIPLNNDTYWFIRKNEFMKVNFKDNKINIIKRIPFSYFNTEMPDNNENIIPYNTNKYIFCLNNGIAILNENQEIYQNTEKKNIYIESAIVYSNEQTTSLPVNPNDKVTFNYQKSNNLVFWVSYNYFPSNNIQYKFKLEGLDTDFSPPTLNAKKEYERLHWGKYILHVKALDNLDNELSTISYPFEISPPFYASNVAIILYILLCISMIIGLYYGVLLYVKKSKNKIAKEQEKLRKEEFEHQEQKIIKLKNKNLEADLTFKSKELATSTMSIIKKNEVLSEIKTELEQQKDKLGTHFPNKYYERLIRLIESNLSSEDDWKIFQANFDRIHENFFRNLKATYPDLTPNDLKLCALLRLNMNTKDMANLMSITVRGIEVARYRLRKKLDIPSEKNLIDFMIEFK